MQAGEVADGLACVIFRQGRMSERWVGRRVHSLHMSTSKPSSFLLCFIFSLVTAREHCFSSTRLCTQDAWGRGDVRVVVATTAFGLGVNKLDVRFVVHHSMSKSVESYVAPTFNGSVPLCSTVLHGVPLCFFLFYFALTTFCFASLAWRMCSHLHTTA